MNGKALLQTWQAQVSTTTFALKNTKNQIFMRER